MLPSLHGNWVDLVILVILGYFIAEGYRVGFWATIIDFLSFSGSLVASLRLYQFTSNFLKSNFSLPNSLSNAIGFLLTAIIIQSILGFILASILTNLPKKLLRNTLNKILGMIPALGEGIILVSFILTLVLAFPLVPSVKADVSNSKIGSYLIQKTAGVEKKVNEVFGGIIEESLTYLTVKPGSRESVPITVTEEKLSVDEKSESEMFRLVNEERKGRGISELILRPEVVPVARNHAKDMWERKYFGHVSPEGEDVGDRLDKARIGYNLAGENLALAPTLATAHNGLMNSEGHRANILEPKFKRVGIGVIDNGVYGKIFVQVFTD